jgi:DNA repair exonuclease SbcCD ATPase subunit
LSNDILKNENNISQYKNKINTLIASIENFYTKKDNIEKNKKLNAEILNVKNDIKTIEYNYNVKNKRIMDLNASLQGNISEKKTIEENVEKIKQLESTSECFKLYIQAFNKDGIPYDLITQVLPSIENEVNSILNKISDFTISLNTDGKNVETCIIYKDKKWPLEMGSGMEKFISSLAIRVALINISNLPRPNFLAVDEGFGCADRDNLAAMSTLFGYLKTQFDFIWIISHLDGMKDMVDKHIEIKKENGFSKVTYI